MTEIHNETFWRKLGLSEWVLIAGLALLCLAFFVNTERLEFVVQTLDFRRWKIFTWFTVVASAAFTIYWTRMWRLDANDPFDEEELFCVKRFLFATSLILVEMWGWIILSTTEIPRYFWFQLNQLFGYGNYSHSALGILLGLALLFVGDAFVIIRWLVAVLNRSVQ